MNINLRKSQKSDMPFLKEMLYEAVFWRDSVNKPSLEEGLELPDVIKALADWGQRDGDTAVVAISGSSPIGAAWYRYWTDSNFIRGYIEETIPVLVIAVHEDYRHRGVGEKMINWLIDYSAKCSIQKISLMVSKDNFAINLYRKCGFLEYSDKGDSILMLRKI